MTVALIFLILLALLFSYSTPTRPQGPLTDVASQHRAVLRYPACCRLDGGTVLGLCRGRGPGLLPALHCVVVQHLDVVLVGHPELDFPTHKSIVQYLIQLSSYMCQPRGTMCLVCLTV